MRESSMSMTRVTVLFDAHCPSCRLLASLLADDCPSHWQYLAWQDFPDREQGPASMREMPHQPRELCLAVDGSWLEGEKAWEFLLRAEPRLRMWQRLASKIGIAPPLAARWLRLMGHGLRRFCSACSETN